MSHRVPSRAALLAPLVACAAHASCIATHPHPHPHFDGIYEEPDGVLIQGMLGIAELTPDLTVDPAVGILPEQGDLTGPLIGGAMQRRLVGDGLELGLEGGFTFTWDRSRTGLLVNGSSLTAYEDVFLADLFGGAFLSLQGEDVRVYVAAGPLLQYGEVELESTDSFSTSILVEDGTFGYGTYARAGFEFSIGHSTFVGIGVRWVDSELDLSGGLDDLDIEALQAFVTVTDYGWVRPYF